MAEEARLLSMSASSQGKGTPFDDAEDEEAGDSNDGSGSEEPPLRQNRLVLFLLLLLVATIAGLLWYSRQGGGLGIVKAANREELPKGMEQCLVYGDPHVATYDQTKPEPSFHGSGEYWLTKTSGNDAVLVQGQFSVAAPGKARTALTRLAVSGGFLGGRTIVIGTLKNGDILLDGRQILGTFPSAFFLPDGMGVLTYNDVGVYVDTDTYGWQKQVVTMRFSRGVSLSVFRWNDFLDVRIRMPSGVPLSGVCGDNNGFGEDDTTEAIYARTEVRVPVDQSLFKFHVDMALSTEAEMLLAKCTKENMALGAEVCAEITGDERQQCYIDICFGTEEHEHTPFGEPVASNGE